MLNFLKKLFLTFIGELKLIQLNVGHLNCWKVELVHSSYN